LTNNCKQKALAYSEKGHSSGEGGGTNSNGGGIVEHGERDNLSANVGVFGSVILSTGKDVETHQELLLLTDLHLNARDLGLVITSSRASGAEKGSFVVDGRVVLVVLPSSAVHQRRIVNSTSEESVFSVLRLRYDSVTTSFVHLVVSSGDNSFSIESALVFDGARHVFIVLATIGFLGLGLIQLLNVSLVEPSTSELHR